MVASEVEMRKLMAFWGMTLAQRPAEAMGEGVYEVTPGSDSGVSVERVVEEEEEEDTALDAVPADMREVLLEGVVSRAAREGEDAYDPFELD
jgi:hypothetical protein